MDPGNEVAMLGTRLLFCGLGYYMTGTLHVPVSVVGLETGLGLPTGLPTGFSWSRSWSRSRYPVVSVLVSVSDLSGLEDLTGLVSRPAFLTTLQHMKIIDYSCFLFGSVET